MHVQGPEHRTYTHGDASVTQPRGANPEITSWNGFQDVHVETAVVTEITSAQQYCMSEQLFSQFVALCNIGKSTYFDGFIITLPE